MATVKPASSYLEAIKAKLGGGVATLEQLSDISSNSKATAAAEGIKEPLITDRVSHHTDVQVVGNGAASAAATEQQGSMLRKIKIKDDFGDEIEEEVNFADDAALQEIFQAKHKSKHLASELELTKSEKQALEARAKVMAEKYSKFEGMSPEDIADSILSERGGLEALISERFKAREEFSKLPEAEQKKLIEAQEAKKRQDSITKREKELDEKLSKLKEQENRTKNETIAAMFRTSASKYSPNTTENAELKKVNSLIFTEAKGELAALEKSGVTLTQSIIDQKFQKAYMNNKSLVEAAKSITTKRDASSNAVVNATKQIVDEGSTSAGTVQQTTSSGNVSETALLAKWYDLIMKGQGDQVDKEVATNPGLYAPLHKKLASRFIRRR